MSTGPLSGMGALVTGGGSGIGLECARRLLAEGAVVTLMGRTEAKLKDAAAELDAGSQVAFHAGDVSDEQAVARAVEVAEQAAGAMHMAVAAAGQGSFGLITQTALEAWRSVLDVNLTGTFLTIKHAAPAIARAGGGSICAVSSIAGPLTHRFMAGYSVSKAGIEALVRNAADELGGAGVRVNAVRPGLVPTDLSSPLVGSQAIQEDYLAQMPLGRLGTTGDVAEAVRYLCGPESSWVTGQLLAVDGGHTLRRGPDLSSVARALYGDAADRGVVG